MKYFPLWQFAILNFLVLLSCGASVTIATADTLHVAPNGKPGALGNAAAPLARVQEALDRARPGATVHSAMRALSSVILRVSNT